jgi:flagellar biosynthetic protein FliR
MNGLFDALTALAGIGQDMLWTGFLVLLRVGAAMALLPAFGEQAVPQRVRLVLALAFTAVVAPAVAPALGQVPQGLLPPVAEVLSGLALGIALRLFILALQIAGSIIAQATSLAQIFGAMGPEPQPAVGHLLTVAGLALAVAAGLHVRVAEVLILSYEALPPGRPPDSADLARWGLSQVAGAFALGFTLAAPFVIAATLYNLAIGVINRAMPQLMVSFVGAPALTAGALVLLAVLTPAVLSVWVAALRGFLDAPFAVPP